MHDDMDAEWERVHSWTRSALAQLDSPDTIDAKQRSEVLANVADALPVVSELQAAGIPVLELGELGNVRLQIPCAVPILLKHLCAPHCDDVTEAIVRALAKPYGQHVFDTVCKFLRARRDGASQTQLFSIGLAIARNATRRNVPLLVELLSDDRNGPAREPIALRAARWGGPEVISALLDMLRSGVSTWTAIRGLRLAKAWDAVQDVEAFAGSREPEVRAEVKRYLAALSKSRKAEQSSS